MNKHLNNDKSGVALIIVLGMLAVLMISAVAFSISMRVERRGATNFRFGVQSKHMIWSALALAMREIDLSMDNASNICVYPVTDVMVSTGSSVRASILSQEVKNSLPAGLYELARLSRPCWKTIESSPGYTVGRYAYVAVNCSGLLDANLVGGGSSHSNGVSPEEIRLDNLADYPGTNFFSDRATAYRFESFRELNNSNLCKSVTNSLVNFYTYSRSVDGLTTGGVSKIDLSGDVSTIKSNKSKIVAGLTKCGIAATDVDFVFSNMVDYLDTDCIPSDLGSPCTESVPMISEFCMSNSLDVVDSGSVTLTTVPFVELCYPFSRATAKKFDLNFTWRVAWGVNGGSMSTNETVCKSALCYGGITDKRRFVSLAAGFGADTVIPAKTGDVINVRYYVKAWMTEPGGGIVDSAPFPTNNWLAIPSENDLTFTATNVVTSAWAGMATIDPRFNWTADYWQDYDPSIGMMSTIGRTNSATTNWFNTVANGADDKLDMYVSDAGRFNSVGELGNMLVTTNPTKRLFFKTLHLFKRYDSYGYYPRNKILDTFTLCSSNSVYHGRVNINTSNTNVLASVLLDTPIYFYNASGSMLANRLSEPDAYRIAAQIINMTSTNQFRDVGEIGNCDWTSLLPNISDCEREAVISQIDGLLTARGNTFTVIIGADSFSTGMAGGSGKVLSSSRAIVELWRDSLVDPTSGMHKWFVRSFKPLTE